MSNLQTNERDESIHPMNDILIEDDYYLGTKIFFVKIGKPAKDPLEGGDYYCPFDISYSNKVISSVVFGINPLQALEMSFQGIRMKLKELER